jgi:hypothetical protein
MLNARNNLLSLWRSRKRGIVLLLAGAIIFILAALTPQVLAGPDPVPLAQTIPPPVGGATLPYAWLTALAPLFALVALVMAAVGVAVVWKRRQT